MITIHRERSGAMTTMKRAMTRIISILAVLLVGFPAYSQTNTSDSLTLEEAIHLVLANNASIKKAAENIAIFEARIDESRTGLMPDIRGDLSYTRLGPVPELVIPEMGAFKFYPANNYNFQISVHQLLFDGYRTKESINLSRSLKTEAVDRLEVLKRDLNFKTAQLFYSILYLQESLRLKNEHLQNLHEHLKTAQKKLEAGTATELDVLNIKVRIASAENVITDLKNNLEKQELRLKQLMGAVETKPLKVEGSFFTESLSVEPEALVEEALKNRPEARSRQDQIQTANIGLHLANLHNRSAVSLNFLGGTKNGYIPNLNTMKLNFVAAVQVDLPIFDGYLTRALKAEAEANLKMIKSQKQEVEDMIKAEVFEALSDLKSSQQKLQSVEANIQQAKKALEFARSHYEAGTITNLDLTDTEDAYTEAEFIRLQAVYQFTISRLALELAIGREIIQR